MTNSETLIQTLQEEINLLTRRIAFVTKHAEILDSLPPASSLVSGYFDFDRLSHDQVVRVMSAFQAGRWHKTPSYTGDRIDYQSAEPIDGFTVRCYQGEPPPNCQIIEVLEEVPAQPATIRTVRKLQCV